MLFLVTFLVYANSISNGFNLDDELVTNGHPLTAKGISAFVEIVKSPYYQDEMGYSYGYRPIVHLSFALQHSLFGENPALGHFLNVLLFCFTVILIYNLLIELFPNFNQGLIFLGVLLFAIHPLHTEVVCSLKNRDELLAFIFSILYVKFSFRLINKLSFKNFLFALLLLTLSVLSKKGSILIGFLPIALIFIHGINLIKFRNVFVLLLIPLLSSFTFVNIESDITKFTFLIFVCFLFVNWLERQTWNKSIELFSFKNFSFSIGRITGLICLVVLCYFFHNDLEVLVILSLITVIFLSQFNVIMVLSLSLISITLLTFHPSEMTTDVSTFLPFLLFLNTKPKIKSQRFYLFLILILTFKLCREFDTSQIGTSIGIILILSLLELLILYLIKFKPIIFGILVIVRTVPYIFFNFSFADFYEPYIAFFLLNVIIVKFSSENFLLTHPKILLPLFFAMNFLTMNKSQTETFVNFSSFKIPTTRVAWQKELEFNNSEISKNSFSEGRILNYTENPIPYLDNPPKFTISINSIRFYVSQSILPIKQSFYYGTDGGVLTKLYHWNNLLFFTGIIILFILFFRFFEKKYMRFFFFSISWFILSIFPFLNVIQPVAGVYAERLGYTASLGVSLIIPVILFNSSKYVSIKSLFYFSLVIVLTIKTIYRNNLWDNPIKLMSHDIKNVYNSAQAHNLLALNYAKFADVQHDENLRKSGFKNAQIHFKRAFELYPFFSNAFYDFGRVSMTLGKNEDAVYGFRKSIKLNPTFEMPYSYLCEYYEFVKNYDELIKLASNWSLIGNSDKSFLFLARGYFFKNDLKSARKELESGIKKFPNSFDIKNALIELSEIDKNLADRDNNIEPFTPE